MDKSKEIEDSSALIVKEIISFIKEYYAIYIGVSILFCSAVGYLTEYRLLNRFNLNIITFAEINDFLLASLKIPEILIVAIIFPAFLILLIHIYVLAHKSVAGIKDLNVEQYLNFHQKEIKDLENEYYESQKNHKLMSDTLENSPPIAKFLFKTLFFYKIYKVNKEFNRLQKENEKLVSINKEGIEKVQETIHRRNNILYRARRIQFSSITLIIIFILFIFIKQEKRLQEEFDRIIENPTIGATVQLRNKTTIPETFIRNQPLVLITATSKFMFYYQHAADKSSTITIPISSIISVRYSDFKIEATDANASSNDTILN